MSKYIVLHNHVSPETAFVCADYPYGYKLRCKIRYWLEFRQGKGYRFCSQTTNPKINNNEFTNKPKYSTYINGLAVMFSDDRGYVSWSGVAYYDSPEQISIFRSQFLDQLTVEQELFLDTLGKISRKLSPNSWADFDSKALVSNHL